MEGSAAVNEVPEHIDLADLHSRFRQLRETLSAQVIGQAELVESLLISLLSDGHLLVEGAPGLAKTTAVKALAARVEANFQRVQFTPDLLPSDLTGTDIWRQQDGRFEFQPGPLFHNLLLADEINRAPAKVQSALLEAMAERQITIGRETYPLPELFLVMATQNPLEQEGTYPLPEAQLDRFLLEIDVGYPGEAAERRMLFATTGTEERRLEAALTAQELMGIQRLVRQIPVPDKVVEAILKLVRSARPGTGASADVDRLVAWGPGPRASQALMLAVRAKALIDGRLAPSVDDVLALAEPVLKHRMALSFAARAEGESMAGVIGRLASTVT